MNWVDELYKRMKMDEPVQWLEMLFRMHYMRLLQKTVTFFTYENLPFPQHELELRTISDGYAGVTRDRQIGIMTSWGGMSGPTEYGDYFTQYTYSAPTAKGGTFNIGENCVILRNTSLMLSLSPLLRRYADLYAHNDISLRMALINSRYQDIIKSTDEAKKQTIEDWYTGLYNGKLCAIIDDTPLSEFLNGEGDIKTLELTKGQNIDFTRFTELENELTRSFYREFGIRWNKDKKSNLVAGEIEQDDTLLEYNIHEMLRSREEFCEEYNRVFKPENPISVRLNFKIGGNENGKDDSGLSTDDNTTDSVSKDGKPAGSSDEQ